MRSKLNKVYLVGVVTTLIGVLLVVMCALLYDPGLPPVSATYINTIIPIIGLGFSYFGCAVIASAIYTTQLLSKKNLLLLVGVICILVATVLAAIIPNSFAVPVAYQLMVVDNAGAVFMGGFIAEKLKKLRYLLILALVLLVSFIVLQIMYSVANWYTVFPGLFMPILAVLFLSLMFVIAGMVKYVANRRSKAGKAAFLVPSEGTTSATSRLSETQRQQAEGEQRRIKEEKKQQEAAKKQAAEEKKRAGESKRRQQAAEKERLAKEEEAARLAKLRQVLKISTRISIAKVAELIRMDEKVLWDRLVEWGDALKFKIDGTDLLVGADSADGFIKALEGEFAKWGKDGKSE